MVKNVEVVITHNGPYISINLFDEVWQIPPEDAMELRNGITKALDEIAKADREEIEKSK